MKDGAALWLACRTITLFFTLPQLATNRTSVFRRWWWWWWWWWWSLRDAAVLLTFIFTLISAFIVKILTNTCFAVRDDRWAPRPEQTTEAQEEHLEHGRPDVQVMNSGSDHFVSSAPTQERCESEPICQSKSSQEQLWYLEKVFIWPKNWVRLGPDNNNLMFRRTSFISKQWWRILINKN